MTAPIKHPWWCDPEWCHVRHPDDRGGMHQSRPATITTANQMTRIDVSMLQGLPKAGNPRADVLLVDLTITEVSMHPDDGPDVEHGFVMRASEAEQLGQMLTEHGRRAAG